MLSNTVKKVAIAMCEADHGLPYERVEMRVEGPTPTALMVKTVDRWETYAAEAARFVAAARALTLDV
jgi:hypothetical protein